MTGEKIANRLGFVPTEPALGNWPDQTVKALVSDEVREFGKFLIKTFRPDLQNINIAYVFKQKASKSGDSVTLGQAKTESDLQKALHSYDAVIIIAFDTWVGLELDQKLRLVLHELEHLTRDMDSGRVKTQPHAVEEFPLVMQVFGPGNDDQITFIQAWEKFKNDNPSPPAV